jgi:RNA polymerase sigma factor (sigma-70 family)
MSPSSRAELGSDCSARVFVTTQWSMVAAAQTGEPAQVDIALESLCCTYWWPLYAFVRRRGYEAHDAQDLTQEFFTRLLSAGFLRGVDRRKGKFRSFLLAAIEHFLAKEWRRASAQKRGGKFTFISSNADWAEQLYLQVPASYLSPEQLYDRQWALTLLDRVLARLRQEFIDAGKQMQFEALKTFLTGEKQTQSYHNLAAELGTTEAALKMAVSRMKQRYGELLRAEIATTVNSPEEIDGELRALFGAFSD